MFTIQHFGFGGGYHPNLKGLGSNRRGYPIVTHLSGSQSRKDIEGLPVRIKNSHPAVQNFLLRSDLPSGALHTIVPDQIFQNWVSSAADGAQSAKGSRIEVPKSYIDLIMKRSIKLLTFCPEISSLPFTASRW